MLAVLLIIATTFDKNHPVIGPNWNTHYSHEPSEPFVSQATDVDSSEPVRIFWTGGFDSTFRVLQALLDENRTVIPYYLSGSIDNIPSNRTRRRNQEMEQRAMDQIRKRLVDMHPDAASRLLPTVVVKHVELSRTTRDHMRSLHRQRVVRRPTCQ